MRKDVEAAYFALLRAREDLTDLQRWSEYLNDEARRLRRFTSEVAAASADAPRRLRRRINHTDAPLNKAIEARLEAVTDELSRMDERLEQAKAYVDECETSHDQLRAREGS